MAETSINPRGPTPPNFDNRLDENPSAGCGQTGPLSTLVEDLGPIVDDIRQIAVDLGARPYTVHVVRLRWTGGEIGRGQAEVSLDEPLLPIPLVRDIGQHERRLTEGGTAERGNAVMTGVSARYTEDELETFFCQVDGEEAFLEVRIDQRDGTPKRRRYTLARPPERRPTRVDWRMVLWRQDSDRQRDGSRRPTRERAWR
jgi:hypothetical protein